MENLLAGKKAQKDRALFDIDAGEKNVIVLENQIAAARKAIDVIQEEIRIIRNEVDRLKKIYTQLEVDVERLRADISTGTEK